MSSRNYEQGRRENSQITNNANNNKTQRRIRLVNNADTIDRIARIITPQDTKNRYEDHFFNGVKDFNDNGDNGNLESLILPAGFSGTSSFP